MRVEDGFQQQPYTLPSDIYAASRSLNSLLRRLLPPPARDEIEADLHRFGKRLGSGEIEAIGKLADGPQNEPRLVQYDHFGRRVDRLETSEGWRRLKEVAAEEGIVAIAYERKTGEWARVHQFAKIYLWVGDSRVVGCPMSVTDGCARVLEQYGTPAMQASLLPLLTSRDGRKAWTAGQFMTEKPGGSDVSRTETVASRLPSSASTSSSSSSASSSASAASDEPKAGDEYILDGFKWFSSATDGELALSLARTGGPGSSGLSLFLLPLKSTSYLPGSPKGNNGVHLHRLKQKIGTKSVPTAELSLSSARAFLVGRLGEGVRTIATVLNITRMHSAFHALGSVGRALMIATSYAQVREVLDHESGKYVPLRDLPAHTALLMDVATLHHALTHLLIPLAHLLGRSELNLTSQAEDLRLRLLTPVAKAFAGVRASKAVQDCIEALGGLGYMDEEPLSRLMRDSLVERIWEGTSGVLGVDVGRVIRRSGGKAMGAWEEWAKGILDTAPQEEESVRQLKSHIITILQATHSLADPNPSPSQPSDPRLPRALLPALGHATAALGMLEQALWASRTPGEEGEGEGEGEGGWEFLKRWVREGESGVRELGRLVGLGLGGGEGERGREWGCVYGRERGRGGRAKL